MHFKVHSYDTLTSTQDEAWHLVQQGMAEGTVVCAKTQSKGKGRYDRIWTSPEGNLYATIIVMPRVPLEQCPQLGLVSAVALAETIAAYTADSVAVKWPNDVLIDGRKTAGILLESRSNAGRNVILIGVGVNLLHYPKEALWPATALTDHGEVPESSLFLDAFLQRFGVWYERWLTDGLAPIRQEWLVRSFAAMGQEMSVRWPNDTLSGAFEGLDERGNLLLRLADGGKTTIHAGDVYFEDKPCS